MLPPELLSEIFQYALSPTEPGASIATVPKGASKPMSLRQQRQAISATCWQWRNVALTTTSLWTSISIAVGSFSVSSEEFVRLETSRAGTRPLNLRLDVVPQDVGPHAEAALVDILKNILPRCETIRSNAGYDLFGSLFQPQEPIQLPLLRSFTDHHDGIPRRRLKNYPKASYDLSLAPKLKNFAISSSIKSLRLPPACGITSLHLGRKVPLAWAIEIIQGCSQLRNLCWTIKDTNVIPSNLDLYLPALESLSYTTAIRGSQVDMLPFINAPVLSTLLLESNSTVPIACPKRFPTVRTLTIKYPPLQTPDHAFEGLLLHFPAVRKFRVDGLALTYSVLNELSRRGEDGRWAAWPRLRSVTVLDPQYNSMWEKLLNIRTKEQRHGDASLEIALNAPNDGIVTLVTGEPSTA